MSAEPLVVVTVEMLRAAIGAASGSDGGAQARVAEALEAIGWRGGDAEPAEDVASEIVPALASCAREHGDRALMYQQVAEILRASGPLLDGGLPPASDYLPAAAEVVRRFVLR